MFQLFSVNHISTRLQTRPIFFHSLTYFFPTVQHSQIDVSVPNKKSEPPTKSVSDGSSLVENKSGSKKEEKPDVDEVAENNSVSDYKSERRKMALSGNGPRSMPWHHSTPGDKSVENKSGSKKEEKPDVNEVAENNSMSDYKSERRKMALSGNGPRYMPWHHSTPGDKSPSESARSSTSNDKIQ